LSDSVHETIARARQAGWLKYLGFVDEATLPLLYAGARAFAYPSIYEGFGLPVLEAMASGVPVLTSDKSCLPEVGGTASLLIDPDDTTAFRDGLERLLDDETWRQPAIARGLARAGELTWEACVERTIAVYRQLA
jgi:alpha-1,3-rhamnosyl/mannosyltransferase